MVCGVKLGIVFIVNKWLPCVH